MTPAGTIIHPTHDKTVSALLQVKYKIFRETIEIQKRWRKEAENEAKLPKGSFTAAPVPSEVSSTLRNKKPMVSGERRKRSSRDHRTPGTKRRTSARTSESVVVSVIQMMALAPTRSSVGGRDAVKFRILSPRAERHERISPCFVPQ